MPCWWLLAFQAVAAQTNHASQIASLIDPTKLATLGERGANPHVQKAVYLLATVRAEGEKPAKVLDKALALAGYANAAAPSSPRKRCCTTSTSPESSAVSTTRALTR